MLNCLKVELTSFFRGIFDSRGWLMLILGALLFLIIQDVINLEVMLSTLGFVFIAVGIAVMARKMAIKDHDLAENMKKAIEENNISAAIICAAIILFMCVILFITTAFLNA